MPLGRICCEERHEGRGSGLKQTGEFAEGAGELSMRCVNKGVPRNDSSKGGVGKIQSRQVTHLEPQVREQALGLSDQGW